MAAPDVGNIIRVHAHVIWNPTDFGAPVPFGGTYLGTCRGIRFSPQPKYREIWAEEWGTVSNVIYTGEGPCTVHMIVRHPDDDMLTTVLPKYVASGSSGIRWVFRPGGTTENLRPGTSLASRAVKLLIAPKALSTHPMLLVYNAIPEIVEDADLRFSFNEEYGLGVKFVGTPDSSGRVYNMGRMANLVL